MRSYTADKYQSLVEDTSNLLLKSFMQKEKDFIASIPDAKNRTLVDLGAGHGRILEDLASLGNNVIAIEINPNMYSELERRAKQFDNTVAIHGDILSIGELLGGQQVRKPVFLVVQNSLGTIEGSHKELLDAIKAQAQASDGQLLLSLFRQSALKEKGLDMYASLKDMVGEVDLMLTDTARGLFVSKTGYTSKWWTDEEIGVFKQLGNVVKQLDEPDFCFLLISF